MDALAYLVDKYKVDVTKPSPIHLPCGRFEDIPKIFRELGFKVGAEIGVYQGEYSKHLLKGIPGLKLHGVDLWGSYQGYKDFGKHDLHESYAKAIENTKGYDAELIRGWSNEVVKRFADSSLDFVFIDGNHAYEWVVWDIANWSRKVRVGGIVYGHDYDDYSGSRRYKEMNVINAVDGWMKSYKIHPWFVLDNNKNKSWLYVKN